jgi:hypothetical protein
MLASPSPSVHTNQRQPGTLDLPSGRNHGMNGVAEKEKPMNYPEDYVPQLPERFYFDLPDALPSDREFMADFRQGMLPLVADTVAQADYLLFFRGKHLQNLGRLAAHVRRDRCIDRRTHPAVLNNVSQYRLAIEGDYGIQRHRLAEDER